MLQQKFEDAGLGAPPDFLTLPIITEKDEAWLNCMDAQWFVIGDTQMPDLSESATFLRMLRNIYCKDVRSSQFIETVPLIEDITTGKDDNKSCLASKNTKVLENLLLDQLATQEYLMNFNEWMAQELEKPDIKFDLSCSKTTKFYKDMAS
jgi:hypothetical protein